MVHLHKVVIKWNVTLLTITRMAEVHTHTYPFVVGLGWQVLSLAVQTATAPNTAAVGFALATYLSRFKLPWVNLFTVQCVQPMFCW